MENNQKDFMKNSPVADKANQYKDVYGTQSKRTTNFLTKLLAVITAGLSLLYFFRGAVVVGCIFAFVFLALVVSTAVARANERAYEKPENINHPDAIFKDHEE